MLVNTNKDKYIIIEVIPTSVNPDKGQLVQLSAIKLKGLDLLDRFDYRMNENNIIFNKILDVISYDKDSFKYVEDSNKILEEFKNWSEDLPILYIDNSYTLKYIKELINKKESILKHLDVEYTDDVIELLMEKYGIQPSNYIVDILYESLIYHSNNK